MRSGSAVFMEHIYIAGQSGSGKSTLIKNLILDNIHAGHGVFYLDPHGRDIDELLAYIPYRRRTDVILFDPSDEDYPIAWNPLEIAGPVALVTSAFERAIKDAAGYARAATPVMSLYIRNSLFALIAAGEPLTGLPFLLTSSRYRSRVLEQVSDPLVKRFWRDFEALTDRDKRQEVASTYNKALALILDPRIRNVLGQARSRFSMRDVLSGKIVLARLPQGRLGFEQVRVLGILLLSQLHLQALAEPAQVPVHVYLDEAHTFDGGTLSEMLSGIRKQGVSITLAHQNLAQLSRELKAAILGNCAQKYIFRVSMADAQELNERLGPDNVRTELYKLPAHTARRFAGLSIIEEKVCPPDHPVDGRVPRLIRSHMRRNYSRPGITVGREISRYIDMA